MRPAVNNDFEDEKGTNPHAVLPSDQVNMRALFYMIKDLPQKAAEAVSSASNTMGRRKSDRVLFHVLVGQSVALFVIAVAVAWLVFKLVFK